MSGNNELMSALTLKIICKNLTKKYPVKINKIKNK